MKRNLLALTIAAAALAWPVFWTRSGGFIPLITPPRSPPLVPERLGFWW